MKKVGGYQSDLGDHIATFILVHEAYTLYKVYIFYIYVIGHLGFSLWMGKKHIKKKKNLAMSNKVGLKENMCYM